MGRYLKGPFPLALYYVHMSDLLKYNTIQYNTGVMFSESGLYLKKNKQVQ